MQGNLLRALPGLPGSPRADPPQDQRVQVPRLPPGQDRDVTDVPKLGSWAWDELTIQDKGTVQNPQSGGQQWPTS